MDKRNNHLPSALKHGAYSGLELLPGEDPAAFKKLHQDLVVEFNPVGPLEEDIVASMARFTWRKQNLLTYRSAGYAKDRYAKIQAKLVPQGDYCMQILDLGYKSPDPEAVRAGQQLANEQARRELGPAWELVEIGHTATTDHLLNELSVVDRLDGMIDRCLKRLLFVRGLKSISESSSKAPARKRLAAA